MNNQQAKKVQVGIVGVQGFRTLWPALAIFESGFSSSSLNEFQCAWPSSLPAMRAGDRGRVYCCKQGPLPPRVLSLCGTLSLSVNPNKHPNRTAKSRSRTSSFRSRMKTAKCGYSARLTILNGWTCSVPNVARPCGALISTLWVKSTTWITLPVPCVQKYFVNTTSTLR